MRQLKQEPENNSTEDSDICTPQEISTIFQKHKLIATHYVAPPNNKYILQIAGTPYAKIRDNAPNVAVALCDHSAEIYRLSETQFEQLFAVSEHTNVISDVKFSTDDRNLVYTSSNDGTILAWDLRSPQKSCVKFFDSTDKNGAKSKSFNCFDISPNNKLLAAGTNLYEGDAFILFWDLRQSSLLGGYWESHMDDITQLKFHKSDSNKLISGSVDGLINLYDLSQTSEDDALIDSLNTESSVEKIYWLDSLGRDIICCVTHTADVQFWKLEEAQPYLDLKSDQIGRDLKAKSKGCPYVVNVHENDSGFFVLAGSNYLDGETLRSLKVADGLVPVGNFQENMQRVRTSFYNRHIDLLVTGGEKAVLNAWNMSALKLSSELSYKTNKRKDL